ncbi:MAG: hypothetical protein R3C28_10830 [Pirellulaceae bacterium]
MAESIVRQPYWIMLRHWWRVPPIVESGTSRSVGADYDIPVDRAYGSVTEMLEAEKALPEDQRIGFRFRCRIIRTACHRQSGCGSRLQCHL